MENLFTRTYEHEFLTYHLNDPETNMELSKCKVSLDTETVTFAFNLYPSLDHEDTVEDITDCLEQDATYLQAYSQAIKAIPKEMEAKYEVRIETEDHLLCIDIPHSKLKTFCDGSH